MTDVEDAAHESKMAARMVARHLHGTPYAPQCAAWAAHAARLAAGEDDDDIE